MNTKQDPPPPHPDQPIVVDVLGIRRFKENPIVSALLRLGEQHGFGLNEIVGPDYSAEDHVQLAQLIGYSVSGFGELSYVSDEAYARATAAAPKATIKARPRKRAKRK